jgi:hypothetical protein
MVTEFIFQNLTTREDVSTIMNISVFSNFIHIQRVTFCFVICLFFILFAQEKTDSSKAMQSPKPVSGLKKQQSDPKVHRSAINAMAKSPETSASAKTANDTLKLLARIIEIPGKFPPNDLYNYVYIMKYKVIKVVKGIYTKKEILVGHYNPLIPRSQIKDQMAETVRGNAKRFAVNDKQTLTLFPLEKVWKDAVEDDYTDLDLESYFALETDTLAQ